MLKFKEVTVFKELYTGANDVDSNIYNILSIHIFPKSTFLMVSQAFKSVLR